MTKNLLDSDSIKIEALRYRNEGFSYKWIESRLGVSKSALQRFVAKETYQQWWQDNDKPIAAGTRRDHHHNIKRATSNTFIITSAQNNTYVHTDFLKTLEVIAEHNAAQIIVGTFSYNKNGFQNLQKGDGEWFDPKIEQYIYDDALLLSEKLVYLGELNILPTVMRPTAGYHSYTKHRSGIIPHAKVQLETLPRHKSEEHARMLYTTGAVTLQNYIQKSAGQKATFHHVFGALLVEIDEDDNAFVRQLIADSETGHVQDLDVLYTPEGYFENRRVEAINWGDIHVEKIDKNAANAAFYDKESMLNALKPKYQFIHDVYDAYYRSHHSKSDWHKRFELYVKNKESVKNELKDVHNFLKSIERDYCETIVVNSNHDRALDRWLNETDYRTDPVNSVFFLELQMIRYKSIEQGENICLLEESMKLVDDYKLKSNFLKLDESFLICGNIECGMHGDIGVGGSKGSAQAFTRVGTKVNIGHSHTAKIIDGVYQAGHLADMNKVDYLKGLNSWSHSHIVTYPNGKRTIITTIGNKWRR